MKEVDDQLSKECVNAVNQLLEALNEGRADEAFLEIICLNNPDCAETLRNMYSTWDQLDDFQVPKATDNHRERFFDMLNKFEREEESTKDTQVRTLNPLLKWAAVLIVGFFIGVFASDFFENDSINRMQEVKAPILTSLESQSPVERLAAIQSIKGIESPEDHVFEAMFQTMTNDPNVNVRLSTIEAMLHFVDRPKARTMLIKSLAFQDDPIVQLTLAEVIIKLQEDGAIEELKRVLNSDQFDREVKLHIQETIEML